MSPSVKKVNNNSGNMAYRSNQNRNRNFAGNYGGRAMMDLAPWESQNNRSGGYMPGQNMNAQVLNLANNLINNLVRTQNPPSLLDLPRGGGGSSGGGGGGMGGNRQRGGQSSGRNGGGGGGGGLGSGNRRSGFHSRNTGGGKSGPKQGGGGITKPNASDRAKKVLAKNSNKKDGKRSEKTESPYADVPNDRFYCHLCKKHMWDADSFENHIKGRNHLTMREGVEESYRIKANMIRQEVKMAEQIKSIEISRMKGKNRNLDYCTMCDLNFHGHISAHRKSDGHLQLKKFLHPKCLECVKEFPTRIDYDSHLLSPDHLKKAAEKNTKVGEDRLSGLQVITEEEELKDVKPPQKKKKKISKKSESGDGTGDVEIKKEGDEAAAEGGEDGGDGIEKETEETEHKEGEEGADESKEGDDLNETQGEGEEEILLPVDPEDCILDLKDDDVVPIDVDSRLPKYNWTRPVGPGFISKLDCFECKLCGKFFDSDKTAEIHSRSVTHHRNFLKLINEKASETKIAEKRAAAAAAAQERKKRKLEAAEKKAAGGSGGGGTSDNADKTNGSSADGGDAELYDPSEATGDDVEMAENGDENGDHGEDDDGGDGDEEGDDADGEGGDDGEGNGSGELDDKDDEKMDTQEPIADAKTEMKEEPKVEAAKTATKTAATSAVAEESPAKKATPARGPAAKATPGRGRGRGRYTRY